VVKMLHFHSANVGFTHSNEFKITLNYSKFLQRHMVVTSEAMGMCERLALGRYSAMGRPGVKPATADCKPSALTTALPSHTKLTRVQFPHQYTVGHFRDKS